jgi:hypothetical protein
MTGAIDMAPELRHGMSADCKLYQHASIATG